MNDRYLYRAKRTDNGEWIDGNRIDDGVTGQVFIHAAGNTVNESDKVGEDGCLRFVAFEVYPSTICQCTGLKDKNEKLIWENDIVKDNVIFGPVSWDDINARFVIDDIQDDRQDYSGWWHEVQVIGNIFDNPELLEVGE